MEKVSIIIPTYNRGQQLRSSIASVLQQTYTDFELLIVDDGSSDNTQEMVAAIPDKRIRYINLAENQGASAARNEGVKQAESSLIAFHDSDDVWRLEKLEKQMIYWQQHPEYSMIYCAYLAHVNGEEYRLPGVGRKRLQGKMFPQLLCRNIIGTPTMLLRRESFLDVGGFDTTLKALEDWDFALRFSEKYEIGYVDEPLVDAYPSEGGISSSVSAYYEGNCRIIARYRKQMEEEGILDTVLNNLFLKAEENGILEEVKKMLLLYIGGH